MRHVAGRSRSKLDAAELAKSVLGWISPHALEAAKAAKLRLAFRRRFGRRQKATKKLIFGDGDIAVMSGPFRGMKYINATVWGPIEPKWIGCYEEELHAIIGDVIAAAYRTIIDVGSAEGYYAVGLARACPQAKVMSYDVDPWSRRQQRGLAKLNDVRNLDVRGLCTFADIDALAGGPTFLMCDIEGGEYALLDPSLAPGLLRCDLLVEIHRAAGHSMRSGADFIRSRFEDTHTIAELPVRMPRAQLVNQLFGDRVPADKVELLTNEDRDPPDQIWLWLKGRGAKA